MVAFGGGTLPTWALNAEVLLANALFRLSEGAELRKDPVDQWNRDDLACGPKPQDVIQELPLEGALSGLEVICHPWRGKRL